MNQETHFSGSIGAVAKRLFRVGNSYFHKSILEMHLSPIHSFVEAGAGVSSSLMESIIASVRSLD